jgi:pyridoxine 5-phosphate synthase
VVRLSVTGNKVATVRNARGGAVPSVVEAVEVCIRAGVLGITVHPRADERHITGQDVLDIHEVLKPHRDRVEYNIEGDPRPELMDRVVELRPDQCTLVPVRPGEITSEAGWQPDRDRELLAPTIARLQAAGVI